MSDQIQLKKEYTPGYGDLTELNTCRLILDTVGKSTLKEIADNCLELLETSGVIYEENGDYALGIVSSGWCQFLDHVSRELCNTKDNVAAFNSGKWICHESCWNEASLAAIKLKEPVDVECKGGIRLYAVPILADGKAVGSMNMGYGAPPTDLEKLQEISERYRVDFDELSRLANEYISRPPQIINAAKSQLGTSAKLIGQIIESKQAGKALKEGEKKYRTLFESSGFLFYLTDRKGKILLANAKGADLFGYSQDTIIGRSFFELRPDRAEMYQNVLENVLSTGETFQFETLYPAPEKDKWLFVTVSPLTIGNNTNLQIVSYDISERKRIELELRNIFSNSFDMICMASFDGFFLNVNPAFTRILGHSEEELLSRPFLDFVHPDDKRNTLEFLQNKLEKGETVDSFINRYRCNDDSYKWIEWSVQPNMADRMMYAIARDITERKQAEELLQQAKNELEIQVEERSNELRRKNIALTEVLGQLEIEKQNLANRVDVNVQKLLLPVIEKLIEKSSSVDSRYLMMIKQNLEELTSSIGVKFSSVEYHLTPKEIELCTLIKGGFSIKEIATMQNLSERTVETHRFNIRKKLGISSSKTNLASYLAHL